MKFILSFLALGVIPLVLLAFLSYHAYLEILQQNVRSYSNEVLGRVERNIQIYLGDLDRMLELRNDYYILQFMKLSIINDIEGNQKFTYRLWENLNTLKNYKTDLRDVAITTLKGVKVGCYGVINVDLTQNDLFQALANRNMRDNTMV
ncbi:MAG TPA: helicase Ski2, partial [Firmicutes bacterium]|nr:helicase Ski2 [Bacillota bacterium]